MQAGRQLLRAPRPRGLLWFRQCSSTDIRVFWRDLATAREDPPRPGREELCAVSIGAARQWLRRLRTRSKGKSLVFQRDPQWRRRDAPSGATPPGWMPLLDQPWPGLILLADRSAGGYRETVGFTGDPKDLAEPVPDPAAPIGAGDAPDRVDSATPDESAAASGTTPSTTPSTYRSTSRSASSRSSTRPAQLPTRSIRLSSFWSSFRICNLFWMSTSAYRGSPPTCRSCAGTSIRCRSSTFRLRPTWTDCWGGRAEPGGASARRILLGVRALLLPLLRHPTVSRRTGPLPASAPRILCGDHPNRRCPEYGPEGGRGAHPRTGSGIASRRAEKSVHRARRDGSHEPPRRQPRPRPAVPGGILGVEDRLALTRTRSRRAPWRECTAGRTVRTRDRCGSVSVNSSAKQRGSADRLVVGRRRAAAQNQRALSTTLRSGSPARNRRALSARSA